AGQVKSALAAAQVAAMDIAAALEPFDDEARFLIGRR
ncbi:MAG: hypothetical protein RLZZ371_1492, partial [Pseudomonadota bacterium]